jgi:hypothetical protein
MPKMIDPSPLERPIEKGDDVTAVEALLSQRERGIALDQLYLTCEHIGARRYDYETPAPSLPHGMMAINSAWGLGTFLPGRDELVAFGLAQGFAMLAAENRAFERARTAARRPVRGLAVPDMANLVIEKVEKGDIAEADGALSQLIESTTDRALIAKAFFVSAAQDLQNGGHKGVFAGHLWQIAERDSFSEIFTFLRPGLHYFAAFGSRDEKRQIERHSADLDLKAVEVPRRQDDAKAVEALAERVLSGGSTRAIVEALQGGFAMEDCLDAVVLAACEDIRNSTNKPSAVETLTYAHAARTAARAAGPPAVLSLFQAGAWAHDCASTRTLTPLGEPREVDSAHAAAWALLEDFAPSQGHVAKVTEAILSERQEAPAWMAPRLTGALLHAGTMAQSRRAMLERYQDRLKIDPELRRSQLVASA